ncbi:CHAT domain-containing tetratricopeptide repeat protein [Armatimonas rosea]|uniref:CHAT domain-containing protein/tetratricopeptide (TPR) repeat protein n=1 Tax=Armatimonas rosea TaxID=685828 RepID=A0A7W9SL74_ARMRO|nr:CHAT domain-containing protein [Armatimonas rosea]MBB6048686.1 CHAT domain-containing protein/tetratricopeptide (TPR) repeat protein [Armatimonas rosea]
MTSIPAQTKPNPEVQALLDRALDAQRQRNFPEALRLLQSALTQARSQKDRSSEVVTLSYLGFVLMNQGRPQEAEDNYQKALTLYQERKDRAGEANTLGNLGILSLNQGLFPKALAYYQQVLPLFRDLGNKNGEGATLTNIGIVYTQLGKPDKALETYLQALPVHQATGNKNFEANTLGNISNLYSTLGEPAKALKYLEQTIALKKSIGDTESEGDIQRLLGEIYSEAGQPLKALEAFEKALVLCRTRSNLYGEAASLHGLATLQSALGQFPQALSNFQQSLLLHRGIGDKSGEANTVQGIGNVYLRLSQPAKAKEFFGQALTLYQAIQQRSGEANTLNSLGTLHQALGEHAAALRTYEKALTVYRAMGSKNGEGNTLRNIGATYHAQANFAKARTYFESALRLLRASGRTALEADVLASLGAVAANTKQVEKALTLLEQARNLYQSVGSRKGEADVLYTLGIVLRNSRKYSQALPYFQKAVAFYESQRTQLGGYTEAKSALLTANLTAYYHYLELLLHLRQGEEAFALAQKTKARGLLDLLAAGRVELSGSLTPEERAQEQDLKQQANFINAQMVREGVENEVGAKKRYAALKEELIKTERALQTLTDTLYSRHPEFAQKRAAKTANLADIAKLLPVDTALLDYIVLSQEKLALFVVTSKGVNAFILPIVYKSLVSKATALRSACADPRKDYKPLATELHKLLLAPAAKQLTGVKRLVICPDGALWDVPFQALLMNGQFLAQRYEISYAYSATGVQAALTVKADRKQPTQTLLAIANPDFGSTKRFGDLDNLPGQRPIDTPSRPIDTPSRPIDTPSRPIDTPSRPIDTPSRPIDTPSRPIDTPSRPIDSPSRAFDSVSRGKAIVALPGTQREADALKKLFPTATLMTGSAAQEGRAKLEASKYKYLHFATHGFFNDASPLLSSLVLAQPSSGSKDDGFLTAREIFDLDLSAEMVVLSACNTARGVQRTGDGVIGLTWALFVAGCPTQVVSQWAVDDASTATLMAGFYSNLATKKQGKGAALRQAALTLLQSQKHAHPYYWAPFVLMGDWR